MKEVYQFLEQEINKDNTIVAGISGGPDSMALLHLLITLRNKKNMNIICAHINHNIREESKEEASILKEYCHLNNVIFEYYKIDKYDNNNFEMEARNKRYAFFEKILSKYNSDILMTAHHGDDLMETILMRLVRGSTLRGYGGFSKITNRDNYRIIRPLIEVTKDDILKYLDKYKIAYSLDNSNISDKYTRNRYRKYVLPFLKKENNKVHNKFLKFSEIIMQYDDFINEEVNKVINDVYKDKILNIDKFIKLNKIIQNKIISYIIENLYNDLSIINDNHLDNIKYLINSNKANSYIYLPNGLKVIKSYKDLIFTKEELNSNNYALELASYLSLPNGKSLEIVIESDDTSNNTIRLNSEEITLPIYVRNKKIGDKINIKGLNGHKKIKDIFIDEKIDLISRNTWPIITDKNGDILWIAGLKKSKYDKSNKESYDIIIKYY